MKVNIYCKSDDLQGFLQISEFLFYFKTTLKKKSNVNNTQPIFIL